MADDTNVNGPDNDMSATDYEKWSGFWGAVPSRDEFGGAFHKWYADNVFSGKLRECVTDQGWRDLWSVFTATATVNVLAECEECGDDGVYPVMSGEYSNQLECNWCDNTMVVNRTM